MPARRTADPALRLVPTVCGIRLASRVTVPAQIDPASTDWRKLGIAVTRITLDGHDLSLDDPRLTTGWHVPEPNLRWTNGAGHIVAPAKSRLEIEHLSLSPNYWLAPESDPTADEPAVLTQAW